MYVCAPVLYIIYIVNESNGIFIVKGCVQEKDEITRYGFLRGNGRMWTNGGHEECI